MNKHKQHIHNYYAKERGKLEKKIISEAKELIKKSEKDIMRLKSLTDTGEVESVGFALRFINKLKSEITLKEIAIKDSVDYIKSIIESN